MMKRLYYVISNLGYIQVLQLNKNQVVSEEQKKHTHIPYNTIQIPNLKVHIPHSAFHIRAASICTLETNRKKHCSCPLFDPCCWAGRDPNVKKHRKGSRKVDDYNPSIC